MEIEIGAPGHGKYIVDGINTRDKNIWGNKWTVYQNVFPKLVKALVCLILPPVGRLLVFQDN